MRASLRLANDHLQRRTAGAAETAGASESPLPHEVRRFAFYLAPSLSMIAFAAAMEPLRIANLVSGRTLYSWTLHSETGEPVRCSNGVQMAVDAGLVDLPSRVTLFVCSGVDVHSAATPAVIGWLRRQDRRGVPLGAFCTGSYLLARAGLLDGRRCTIHWESLPAAGEEFPDLEFSNRIFEIDGNRFTCAGGTAAADMMLRLITEQHGPGLSGLVAEQALYATRGANDEQRTSVSGRYGVRHPRLVSILRTMEANLEHPVRPATLARQVGMSVRQLERLFRRYLNCSPKRYYMELRLTRARNLLMQTEMSVLNVALACGFTSPSHFSKCYRRQFERTPYRDRCAPESPVSRTA